MSKIEILLLWTRVLYTMMHHSQFQGLSSSNKTAVIKLKWQNGRGKTFFKLKASHSDARFYSFMLNAPQHSVEPQVCSDSLPAEEVFGYLAEARSNVKQTHLRNKLLPFSTLRSSAFHDKSNLFGNMRRRKRARFTFRSATGNIVIYNLRLVAGQNDAASPDYFKCSSRVGACFRY